MNKYEMIMIASREARRLNEIARLSGRELKERPTTLAWKLLTEGKIKYTYNPETLEEQLSAADILAEGAAGGQPEDKPEERESEIEA